jgi:membrane protease YdiL (CAAX protease family)
MANDPDDRPIEPNGSSFEPSLTPLSPAPLPAGTHAAFQAEIPSSVGVTDADRANVWLEVAAVLAVGVIPNLISAIIGLARPWPPDPYWADTLNLAGTSLCVAFVTLYLISRSGEPWKRFGLSVPVFWDIWLGVAMFVLAEGVLALHLRLAHLQHPPYPFPKPRAPEDYVMMVVKLGASSFTEELITRAYLITRLEQLLRSRWMAVILSAVAFTSYHLFLGPAGLVQAFAFSIAYGVGFLAIRRVWPLVLGNMMFMIHWELMA